MTIKYDFFKNIKWLILITSLLLNLSGCASAVNVFGKNIGYNESYEIIAFDKGPEAEKSSDLVSLAADSICYKDSSKTILTIFTTDSIRQLLQSKQIQQIYLTLTPKEDTTKVQKYATYKILTGVLGVAITLALFNSDLAQPHPSGGLPGSVGILLVVAAVPISLFVFMLPEFAAIDSSNPELNTQIIREVVLRKPGIGHKGINAIAVCSSQIE
jgi:hypothetical protein